MSTGLILLVGLGVAILIVGIYMIYCLSSNEKITSAIRIIFSIVLVAGIILGFGSYFHSCSAETYNSGYEAGYEAGVEAGIEMVKEHPYDYF